VVGEGEVEAVRGQGMDATFWTGEG